MRKISGIVTLARVEGGIRFNVAGLGGLAGTNWHDLLYRGEKGCRAPQTQGEMVAALHDVLQSTDYLIDGDFFMFSHRVVARVAGTHVVRVTAEESLKDYGMYARALAWPGSITIKVNNTEVDGAKEWDTIDIAVDKEGVPEIKTSLIQESLSGTGWNSHVLSAMWALNVLIKAKAVEFRSIEFEEAVRDLYKVLEETF